MFILLFIIFGEDYNKKQPLPLLTELYPEVKVKLNIMLKYYFGKSESQPFEWLNCFNYQNQRLFVCLFFKSDCQ